MVCVRVCVCACVRVDLCVRVCVCGCGCVYRCALQSTYLGSSFAVTDVADATTESVSGTTGMINAPAGGTADAPSSPSSGSGTNMGLIIGAIAGGVVAGALFAFLLCYFLGRRTATPMVNSGPTVATEKPTSGLVTHPEKTVTGYM
jgi:hypothetical protein